MSGNFAAYLAMLADMAPPLFATLAIAAFLNLDKRYAPGSTMPVPDFKSARMAQAMTAVELMALLICIGMAVSMLFYLMSPGYFDHLEPLMAATAYMSSKGLPLHPAWSDALYGDLYGPFGYQLLSLGLLVQPTMAGSKIVTLLCTAAAFFFQYGAFRRISQDRKFPLRLTAMAVIVSSNTIYLLSNRPDPILFLMASIGIYALGTDGRLMRAIFIGAAAGLATDMKVHGFLYLAPAAAALVAMQPNNGRRILCVLLGVGAAILAALFPFTLPGTSLAGYWAYLEPAAGHGLAALPMLENVAFWPLLIVLPGLAYFALRPRLPLVDRVFLATLTASSAIVGIIGSKAGSGVHHLYPFLPTAIYGLGRILTTPRDRHTRFTPDTVLALLLAFMTVTLGFSGMLKIKDDIKSVLETLPVGRARLAELDSLAKIYPQAEMGVTDEDHYSETFLFPVLVFSGHGFHFNAGAWMDLKQDNVDERNATALLTGCRIPVWILPSDGAPFSMPNYYTWQPLFSSHFRALFSTNYRLARHGMFYNAWTCRSARKAGDKATPT